MNKNFFRFFSHDTKKILIRSEATASEMMTKTNSGHILLATLDSNSEKIQRLLERFILSQDRVHLALSFSELTKTSLGSGLTLEAKEFLKASIVCAKEQESNLVFPEHFLLAVCKDKNFEANKILSGLGVDLKKFQSQILNLDSEISEEEKEDAPGSIFDAYPKIQPGASISSEFTPQTAKESSVLKNYAVNLNKKAALGELFPIVGREQEINRLQRILIRKTKNNPVLVGDPGVGKTAIVEGLAQKITAGKVNEKLKDCQIWMLDLALLVAGTKYRGEFEERVKKLIREVSRKKEIVLFVDEVHSLVGTGSAEGSMDTANILKPALSRGDIRLIGATTFDDYRKYIEKDAALERRMQQVRVSEPTENETLKILTKLKELFENHHGVKITEGALKSAVSLSRRYIGDRYLPDKAIDVLDEAAAAKSMLTKLETEDSAKQSSPSSKKSPTVGIKTKVQDQDTKTVPQVDEFDVAKIVAEWTKIPLSNIFLETEKRFINIEKRLSRFIVGQKEAIDTIALALKRSETGVTSEKRPIGSFIFLGPTGVGKTELAKVLAREIFGDEDALIKIDMSEFMEKHNLSRLVGAPPGYIGYEEAGKLTEKVRQNPYSVVLLDEIEKAHPDVYNLLLQILEDGYLTDAKGRRVNFRNTIIIMTSNLGTREFISRSTIGFTNKRSATNYKDLEKEVRLKLNERFTPEFLNRIDKIIIFKPLGRAEIEKIVKLQLNELAKRLKVRGIKLFFDQKVINFIAKNGFDPNCGARPIRKTIRENIEDPIAETIIKGKLAYNKKIDLKLSDKKIEIS